MAEILVSDFTFGLPIHYEGDRISSHSTNLVSALQKPEEEDLNIEKLELEAGRLATTILYFPGVSVDFSTYMRVLFTYMRALYIICLIAIMPHPLLTLVFEPLVIAINCPVYPSPPTPFLLLRCSKLMGRSVLAWITGCLFLQG